MLYRVMAPEGRGKTTLLFRRLAECVREKKRSYVLVPEQITAETERAVLTLCGAPSNETVEVCNFSRLSNLVMRETGGVARRFLTPSDKNVILAAVGRDLKDQFRALSVEKLSEFASEAAAALSELSAAGLGGAEMERLSKEEGFDKRLADKLSDLHLLDAAYRASLQGRFDDPDEETAHLAKRLKTTPFFRGAAVFVDAFWDFTAPETDVLREILKQADEVWISFCCEKTGDDPLFAKGKKAAENLYRIAGEEGVDVKDPSDGLLEEEAPGRIGYLKTYLMKNPLQGVFPPEDDGSVTFTACRDRFDEARYVASEIQKLVRSGMRYREIAVLSRSGAEDDLFGFVFDQCGIPHFSEKRTPLSESALAETVLTAVAMAKGDTRRETLHAFLRHAILPVPEEERFLLKKYAVTWSLSGSAFLSGVPFDRNPEGYLPEEKEPQKQELAAVNAATRRVFDPVRRLSFALASPKARDKVGAVVNFLRDLDVEKSVFAKIAARREAGDFEEAGALSRNWNRVLERLGSLSLALGEKETDNAAFADLLTLALSGEEAGAVPPSQDLVMLGALPFTRQRVRAVFVTNLNAGVFPPEESGGGILTPREKEALAGAGFPFPERAQAQQDEFFLFYLALSFAGERLSLSFLCEDRAKALDECSVIGRRVRLLLGQKDEKPPFFDPETAPPADEGSAFRWLCAHLSEDRPDAAFLREYFMKKPEYAGRLLDAAGGTAYIRSGMTLQKHRPYPKGDVPGTYSRLERYSWCPYQFFAEYLLGAKRVRRAEFGTANAGTFVHAVMEEALKRLSAEGKEIGKLTAEEVERLNGEVCEAILADMIRDAGDERTRVLARRLKRSTLHLLSSLNKEFSAEGFRPLFMEKKLEDLGGYRIPLPDGRTLTLYGSIDRVDLYHSETDGRDYIRVVDYKTGGHDFSLERVANGIDLQMLLYLFALWTNGFELKGKKIDPTPAGIIYSNGLFAPQRCKSEDDIALVKNGGKSSFSHTGLLLNEPAVLAVQDPAFLPAYQTAKGKEKTEVLATLEEFGKLREMAEKAFVRLAEDLKAGKVDALPLRSEDTNKKVDPCRWCDYRAMCKNDPKTHCRPYRTVTRDKVFAEEVPNG